MMIKTQKLRRLYEAAVRDRDPEKFHDELDTALATRQVRPEDFSVRELFENFVPDGRELVSSWNPRQGPTSGVLLLEEAGAVTSSSFPKITGQIIYNAILQAYQEEQFYFSSLVKTIPTQFSGEKIAGISRIGDELETIGEGRPYPQAAVSEDYIETPATTKRGMIVGLTKEAIFFDRTNVLTQRCGEVGLFLGINKEKRLVDCVIDEGAGAVTGGHRYKWKGTTYATYQAASPWINLKATNALVDWTSIDALEQTIAAITDPYTGEPILVQPKHLVVPRQLLYTAKRITQATEIRTANPGYAVTGVPSETLWSNPIQNYQIVSSFLLQNRITTKTHYFLGDIGRAFAYMENWPLTVVQAPNNTEVEFTQDVVMRWKASERGAAATLDPRYMCKGTP